MSETEGTREKGGDRAVPTVCLVAVGHPEGTPATWLDTLSGLAVCDRHRGQYDQRTDLGPYVWVRTL